MKSKLSLAAAGDRPLRLAPLPDPDRHLYQASYERHLGQLLIDDEPAAPAGLWDHFAPMVRGLLSRALGPSEDIEPPIEDVFFHVHRRRDRLGDPEHVRQFILAAVIDQLRARLRRRRWRRSFERLLGSPRSQHRPLDGGPVTAHRLALADLYGALETLSAGERLAVTLHFFEGLALAEAAALARTSVPAFERQLEAARHKLDAAGLIDRWIDGDGDGDLHRLARLARAASSRPLPANIGRATRRRFLDRVARTAGNA